jgi:hypothetical protein
MHMYKVKVEKADQSFEIDLAFNTEEDAKRWCTSQTELAKNNKETTVYSYVKKT